MVRVAHQKSAKQATTSNGVRGPKVAKQRKNHKVVIESDSQDKDKDKSRAVLSFRADPPPGYTFIPAGNPQLTAALKEFAKKGNYQILAVTTTPHATRHELSREVHRIGFHFPTEVVAQVCNHYGIRLTKGGKLVEEKDDDKLFMRLYQKGQLVLDEKVRDQVTINTEAKQIIQDLFPHIPDNDLFQIIKTAFQLGDGKVGTADEIPLVRRAQLSVVAHIRHTYTNYDKLLRSVPYSEARHRVENITLQKLIDWRGDGKDDNQAMDDTLREVVVISDEEDSDEVEEGQVLENQHLRIQPVSGMKPLNGMGNDRPQSPIEIYSDDEAPRGYRYLPQVVQRVAVHDAQAALAARQQSRYAVWDRVRQEYRSGAAPQQGRVVERILIDSAPTAPSPTSYVTRESLYAPEVSSRRVIEPVPRVPSQSSTPTFIRGADGKLYERVTTYPQQAAPPVSLRRVYTPPLDHGRQYIDSRPVSPPPPPPRLHRRTESYENNDGTVLPSIEGSNAIQMSPSTRHNPFEEQRLRTNHRNSGAFNANQHHGQVIDLTYSAEQASKRRRAEATPPSSNSVSYTERSQREVDRIGDAVDAPYSRVEYTHPSQQRQFISLDNPAVTSKGSRSYVQEDSRMPQTYIYREPILDSEMLSPRSAGSRQVPLSSAREPNYVQSPRRLEYVHDYDMNNLRSHGEPGRQHVVSYATTSAGHYDGRAAFEVSQTQNRGEPLARYVRSEVHNPFEAPLQSQYHVQEYADERPQREYTSSVVPHYVQPTRDVRMAQVHSNEIAYQQQRTIPPQLPPSAYRNAPNVRPTYVQN